MSAGDARFSSHGESELVTGTLRGYRCWRLMARDTGQVEVVKTFNTSDHDQLYDTLTDKMRGDSPQFFPVDGELVQRPLVEPVLTTISTDAYWPGPELRARCVRLSLFRYKYENTLIDLEADLNHYSLDDDHGTPRPDCTCGIYGWYTPDWALVEHAAPVMGVIEVSGRTLLGTVGFRAERARIIAVTTNTTSTHQGYYLHESRCLHGVLPLAALGKRYPGVRVFQTKEEMIEAYPPDHDTLSNLGVTPEPVPRPGAIDSTWPFSSSVTNVGFNAGSLVNYVITSPNITGT